MKTKRPLPNDFDSSQFKDNLKNLHKNMGTLEIEHHTEFLVPYILEKYEGFEKIEKGPDFRGSAFDFFGFKNGAPYIIEYKGSLNSFNTPGETQKRRLQEILKQFDKLEIALLQVKIEKSQYRIFYSEDMEILFKGKQAALEPIIQWLKDRIE